MVKEEFNMWKKNMGLEFISRPEEDKLKSAIELTTIQLDNMPLSDLDEFLLVLSNYYLFLSSHLGLLSARSVYLKNRLDTLLASKTTNVIGGTAAERRTLLISKDKDIKSIDDTMVSVQSKMAMLEPVTDAVKLKIDSLKRIYFRRTAEARAQ